MSRLQALRKPSINRSLTLERKKKRAEFLDVMQAEAADWIGNLLSISIPSAELLDRMISGALLCDMISKIEKKKSKSRRATNLFYARENVNKFLRGAKRLGVLDDCLFETNDLVERKNDRKVLSCFLELARIASLKFGVEAPLIVQYEREIEEDIRNEKIKQQRLSEGKPEIDESTEEEGAPSLPPPVGALPGQHGIEKPSASLANSAAPASTNTTGIPSTTEEQEIHSTKQPSKLGQPSTGVHSNNEKVPVGMSSNRKFPKNHRASNGASIGVIANYDHVQSKIDTGVGSNRKFPKKHHASTGVIANYDHVRSKIDTGINSNRKVPKIQRSSTTVIRKIPKIQRTSTGVIPKYGHIQSKVDCHLSKDDLTAAALARPEREISAFKPARDNKLDRAIYKFLTRNQLQGAVPFERVSDKGKYKVGSKVVYIREIRNTLLVRVGGGWQSLKDFAKKQAEASVMTLDH